MTIGRGPGASFFQSVNRRIRQDNVPFVPPAAWYQLLDDDFGEIWFPSHGCPWSVIGTCSMCNYGVPLPPTDDQMVGAIALALASFERLPSTLWVSSFDVLDPRDVPVDVRRQIYRLLARTPTQTIISESHPLRVRFADVKECVDLLEGKIFGLELGIETMDDFVRNWCLHKNFLTRHVCRAIDVARAAGAEVYANLFVGAPFLTTTEWIEDAVDSTRAVLEAGADSVVLLPCHVKRGTLCDWLYQSGLYRPPSLWTVMEILMRVEPRYWPRIRLSWIATKEHPGHPQLISPVDEHETPGSLLAALSKFNQSADGTVFQPLLSFPEYIRWHKEMKLHTPDILPDRIAKCLPFIAKNTMGYEWWSLNERSIKENLWKDWSLVQK